MCDREGTMSQASHTHKHSETLLSLALIRLTNAAALFLCVLPTPLRGYCCAVRQHERQLPCGSGETKGGLVLRTHLNARKYEKIGKLPRLLSAFGYLFFGGATGNQFVQ